MTLVSRPRGRRLFWVGALLVTVIGALALLGRAAGGPASAAPGPDTVPAPPGPGDTGGGSILPWVLGIVVLAGLAGAALYFAMRRPAPAAPLAPAATERLDSPLEDLAPVAVAERVTAPLG